MCDRPPEDELPTISSSSHPRVDQLAIGATWGKFVIEKRLGKGGQAYVYQAYDRIGPLGRVALKIPRHVLSAQQLEAWARSEIDPLLKLKHPNIIKVVDAGCIDAVPYVATPLTDMLPLNNYVKTHRVGPYRILRWLIRLADAAHAAHSYGIVHRDLKPHNILIEKGSDPVIIDFGIAGIVNAYQPSQEPGSGLTPAFAAPEQAREQRDADHRVDVFALGGVLKFLLERKKPYESAKNARKAARENKVEPADDKPGPPVRRALARIANRALDPDPNARFATAGQMARALRRLRNRRYAEGLGAAALFLLVVGILLLRPFAAASSPKIPNIADKEVLKIIYTESPPQAAIGFPQPALRLAIYARRAGAARFALLQDGDVLASEADDYLVAVQACSPGYLYIFQIDSAGRKEWLFPENESSPFSSGSNPLKNKQFIHVPAAELEQALYLDTTIGIEHIYVVFSAARWDRLENALAREPAPTVPPRPAGGATSDWTATVQQPNGLQLRGVGGVTPIGETQSPDVIQIGAQDGVQTVAFHAGLLRASGSFLVLERWFRHVAPE